MPVILISLLSLIFSAFSAVAQTELSFFSGSQTVAPSRVTGDDSGGIGPFSFLAHWEGDSFEAPPYFGVRLTWWRSERVGWGLELNRSRITATDGSLTGTGINDLTISDGLNMLTVNAYRRWPTDQRAITPYVGAGLGVSVPNVEYNSGSGQTAGYQLTGPAVQWLAGASIPFGDHWSLFGEYKGSLSANNADLLSGGNLNATVFTNAVNVGVSLGF